MTYLETIVKKCNKQLLEQLYFEKGYSVEELAQEFDVSGYAVTTLLKYYNIVKPKELKTEQRVKKFKATRNNQGKDFQTVLDRISKEELYQKYITENVRYEELLSIYSISGYTLDKLLNYYDIHKSRAVSSKMSLETKYAKYGSKENYFRQLRETQIQNIVDKYGSLDVFYSKVSDACKKYWYTTYTSEERKEKIKTSLDNGAGWKQSTIEATNIERYGVPNQFLRDIEFNYQHRDSKPNLAFKTLLETNGFTITENDREFKIANRAYDFKIGHTLIEINPSFTHNSTFGFNQNSKDALDKFYHRDKSQLAANNGYSCICIWDWDNPQKIIELLKERPTCYGRSCSVKLVDKAQEQAYLTKCHLQGYVKSNFAYGLYLNEELVSIMTFGKPRYNKNFEYELLRYCSSYNVIGGAKKLFSHFVHDICPSNIISYCDLSKFSGKTYIELGFTRQTVSVSKHWFSLTTGQHITDNLLRQRGFDQLFGTIYGKGTSNEELMKQSNFVEIYDCGQATYIWHSNG